MTPTARLYLGYTLLGFGVSFALAGVVLLRIAFLPGRHGGPLVAFSFDDPLSVIDAILLGLGVLLIVGGRFCIVNGRAAAASVDSRR